MNRLRFSSFATEYDLRLAIMDAGRISYERGLISASDGTISARLGDDMLVITPAGLCKGRLDLEDLLVVDLTGDIIKRDPKRHLAPPQDTLLFLQIYRARPDVRAIIHACPKFELAMALDEVESPVEVDVVESALSVLGQSPEGVSPRSNYVILPAQLGSLSVGEHLEEALMILEHHEHIAEISYYAHMLGKRHRTSPKK